MKKVIVLIALLGVAVFAQQKGSFTDSRDKKTYKTVKMGVLTWMAENLNAKIDNSVCYENKDGNCKKYGRLYDWETAKKACPSGWHLPTDAEWDKLFGAAVDAIGFAKYEYPEQAVDHLKGKNGFAALLGGYGGKIGLFSMPESEGVNSSFSGAGEYGVYWSATEDADLSRDEGIYGFTYMNGKHKMYSDPDDTPSDVPYLFSVRCVKD
jgi:uncharacterized protein (TIGR02145 family)